jgi:hypothetical protein
LRRVHLLQAAPVRRPGDIAARARVFWRRWRQVIVIAVLQIAIITGAVAWLAAKGYGR